MNTTTELVPRPLKSNERPLLKKILTLLGGDAVLLPVVAGQKNPIPKAWPKIELDAMADGEYLAQFDEEVNIGVSLGKVSHGLCSIDLDRDEDVAPFLALNPKLAYGLRTRGARGCNFWVRINGEYPPLTRLRKSDGADWGEWRADGGQTVIHGRHPSGCDYMIQNNSPPVEMQFDEIIWPDVLVLPWKPPIADAVVARYGEPFVLNEKDVVVGLNERFWGGLFLAENLVIHEPAEREFYQYDATTGLWRPVTPEALHEKISARLFQYRQEENAPDIEKLIKQARVKPVVETLRGQAEKQGAFANKPRIIHFSNGVVRLTPDEDIQFGEFRPDDYSRNQSPIAFSPDAACPRFLNELLRPAINSDDLALLQRWVGVALFGHNLPQRILLLIGTPGGGKSTAANVISALVGPENCYQLRTENLLERFEIFRYRRKTLLIGADVPGDFLSHRGASRLKSLVGGDLLSAEGKGSNGDFLIRGTFNVLITCNSRLRVRLEGDTGAWRRRLLIVNFQNEPPERKIQNFADLLVQEEGAGIALWALQGFVWAMNDFDATGDFKLTGAQLARVDGLLAESDSVEHFLKARVVKDDGDITCAEMTESYSEFCSEQGWSAAPITVVSGQLTDLLLRLFQCSKRHDVQRTGKPHRGWVGVRFK